MKRLIYVAAFLASLVSCSKEQNLVPVTELTDGTETVVATAKDFVAEGATKTTITQSGNNPPAFAWKEGDVIGVIPMNNETVQSNYKIAEIGSNPKRATFDGGVWALKEGKEYAAYYPFKKEAVISDESIGFSFLGQSQSANNSLEHLGDYDYMYASAVVPQNGSAQFDFEHKISLVCLQLTVPADTYTKVVLESSTNWFANGASLKLSDGTMTATETFKSATINLNNIAVADGNVLTVWFATLPTTALSGHTLSVKLFGSENTFTGEITELSALKSGSAYSYALSFVSGGQEVEYVDLGLPSGIKWASCNLGASKPEEYGGHYQWAGLQDVTDTKIYLNFSNCPYNTGSYENTGWTKYIPSDKLSYWSGSGSPDNKTVLDPEDDIAHVKLGDKWRMPTKAEFQELMDNCTSEWTTLNGVKGRKFTSKKNGNSIFLPAAGMREYDCLYYDGSLGYYWSSTLYVRYPYGAYEIHFRSDYVRADYDRRDYGFSVRPVYDDQSVIKVTGVIVEPSSISLGNGKTVQLNATVMPSNATNKGIIWSTSNISVATVSADGLVTAINPGEVTITARTSDGGYTATCSVTVTSGQETPEAVDLGLSVKWATCNVGASKPEDCGDYYAWGETETKSDYSVSTYKWCNGSLKSLTKYYSGDNKTVLDLADDVAHVKLGGKWRMPTADEFNQLISVCTVELTTVNGVAGRKFTSKKTGNSIFLPTAGIRQGTKNSAEQTGVGIVGHYRSSTLSDDGRVYAWILYCDPDMMFMSDGLTREFGLPVRPVTE